MPPFKRPMLAAQLMPKGVEHTDENILAAMQKLRYPVIATPKMDGIRGLRLNKSLLSRTLKEIPNKRLREKSLILPGGFDIELCNNSIPYHEVESIVMSQEHPDTDKIKFYVIDWYCEGGYTTRYVAASNYGFLNLTDSSENVVICFSDMAWCSSAEELFNLFLDWETQCEGICFRTPDSPYKQGRSTLKEQYLVKLCRYIREEVSIIGLEELMINTNDESYNALGLMDRSKAQDGLVPSRRLGAFVVQDTKGRRYNVGTGIGLTSVVRREVWEHPEKYIGKKITVKMKPFGEKDNPRSPVFVGFREDGY